MKILALEFSSPQRSVAVLAAAGGEPQVIIDASTGRDMKPLALIEAALAKAGMVRGDIDCIAVGLGPGSYTGIRVAISVAQGWQLATGVKLIGVSSVACLAAQVCAAGEASQFNVVVDAQRGELYLARYGVDPAQQPREISPLHLTPVATVQKLEAASELFVGPEVTRWIPQGKVVFPQAATLAQLAKGRSDFLPGEKLEPIYLRETTFVKVPLPRVRPEK